MKFEKLGLKPEILKGVESRGYKDTTPIQAQAIPAILDGRDIMGGAQTGTGKTAAFALPVLQLLNKTAGPSCAPRSLILTPTRELADQVAESFKSYGQFLDLSVTKLHGGVKMSPQVTNLKNGTDIIIATPGRLMDHILQDNVDLSEIRLLVLDEADRMLDMGFINDIKTIIDSLTKKSQNLLFSATYSQEVESLAKKILKNPVMLEVAKRNAAAEDVKQILHYVDKGQRYDLLLHLIQEEQWYQVLIFVKTKHSADRLATQLLKDGIPSLAIHGDKSQGARNRALKNFKSGDLQALIATDVAARGIDLDDLSHVVNYELPQIPEDYIHRIGRTGRAGKSGTAISLVSFSEKNQLKKIEKILKYQIPSEIIPGFEPKHDIDTVLSKNQKDSEKGNKKQKSERFPSKKSYDADDQSSPGKPRSSRPGSSRPGSSKPGSSRPGSSKPGSSRPGSSRQGSSRPGSSRPGSSRPGSSRPGTEKSGKDSRRKSGGEKGPAGRKNMASKRPGRSRK